MTKTVLIDREVVERLMPRIAAAIKRITDGQGCMRIPADMEDPDLVLAECRSLFRASLESAQAGEPVAWMWQEEGFAGSPLMRYSDCPPGYVKNAVPLYAAPLVHLTGAASQERNSQRYLWLRKMQPASGMEYEAREDGFVLTFTWPRQFIGTPNLDAAIDAAMQSTPPAPRSAE